MTAVSGPFADVPLVACIPAIASILAGIPTVSVILAVADVAAALTSMMSPAVSILLLPMFVLCCWLPAAAAAVLDVAEVPAIAGFPT